MEAKVNYAIVGGFVLLLGAALIAGVLWLSSGGAYRKTYDTYFVYMKESVSGLSLDAPVRYRGVEIGRVRRIALAPEDIEQVQLTMDIERGTPVKADTVAVLRVQGLTGIAYIELTGGHRDSPPLAAAPGQEYPVIGTGPSLMVRLDATLSTLAENLTRTTGSLNAVMDEGNRLAFKRTLADLEVLTRTVAARSAAIDQALASAARTLDNTAKVSAEMPKLIASVQRSAEALEKMSNEVAGAGASARQTLDETRGDMRQFSGETLTEVRQLVAEMRELTGSLQHVAAEIERNPGALLFGKSAVKKGPGE
jgi:phospholipid/cholesterol/gamma-HCH transport system substrate-binding protein